MQFSKLANVHQLQEPEHYAAGLMPNIVIELAKLIHSVPSIPTQLELAFNPVMPLHNCRIQAYQFPVIFANFVVFYSSLFPRLCFSLSRFPSVLSLPEHHCVLYTTSSGSCFSVHLWTSIWPWTFYK